MRQKATALPAKERAVTVVVNVFMLADIRTGR
jgi:hypothetical protein